MRICENGSEPTDSTKSGNSLSRRMTVNFQGRPCNMEYADYVSSNATHSYPYLLQDEVIRELSALTGVGRLRRK